MKRYIIKNADGSEQSEMQAIHNTRKEAGETLMDYICDHNEDLDVDDDDYLSPFDFVLEEVECKEVNEVITDFDSARKALGGKPNADFTVSKKILSGNVVQLNDVARLVTDINPMHIEALIALNELFTIAEAWNKEDGFVPYFSDESQYKWFPWFEYNNNVAKFVCKSASYTSTYVDATFGHRLCFKTEERAKQFGKQKSCAQIWLQCCQIFQDMFIFQKKLGKFC